MLPLAPAVHAARRLKQQHIVHAPINEQRVQRGLVKAGQQFVHHHHQRVVNLQARLGAFALAPKLVKDGLLIFAAVERCATHLALLVGVEQQHRAGLDGLGVLHKARVGGQSIEFRAQQLLVGNGCLDGVGRKQRLALPQRAPRGPHRQHGFGTKHQRRLAGHQRLPLGVLVNLIAAGRTRYFAGLELLEGLRLLVDQVVFEANHVLDRVQDHPVTNGLRHGVGKVRRPADVVPRSGGRAPLAKARQDVIARRSGQANNQIALGTHGPHGAPLVKNFQRGIVQHTVLAAVDFVNHKRHPLIRQHF